MARTKKTVTFLDTPALPTLGAIRKKTAPKKKPEPKKKRIKRAPSKEKIAKIMAKPKKANRKLRKDVSEFAGQRTKSPLEPKITHHVSATPVKHTAITPHTPSIPHTTNMATHQIKQHTKPQHHQDHQNMNSAQHKKKHKQVHQEKRHDPILDPDKPIEHQLAENLVALQKVNIRLAEKFDKMEKQLSELLHLFEMAARSLAKQPENQTSQKDKDFLNKIDRLLEQNKTIAKGLTLMEDHVRSRIQEKPQTFHQEPEARPSIGRPLPRF
jgi:hypothetical protein